MCSCNGTLKRFVVVCRHCSEGEHWTVRLQPISGEPDEFPEALHQGLPSVSPPHGPTTEQCIIDSHKMDVPPCDLQFMGSTLTKY